MRREVQGNRCWCGALITYHASTTDVGVQHGANPEAVYRIPMERVDDLDDDLAPEVYAWFDTIHAYEAPADAPPRGRGAE